MNSDTLKGKWKELKGAAKVRWGRLTDDDLDVIAGQADQLIGRLQQRYGIAQDEAQKQVDDWNATRSQDAEFEQKRKTA
ncbi:MAG TPA: CsbD family protein [Candidatus Dormibacteraeota bacterium]|nr:CsbD family protein [Candidatus Dormibacteraeota bacterium]